MLEQVRENGRTPLIVSSVHNPIETVELISSLGWHPEMVRNVWLRTAGQHNSHSLNWLREQRINYSTYYFECLENITAWNMNLILDEDEKGAKPWPHQYDPDYDFLFGCGPGLPETVWRGKHIFQKIENCPPVIMEALEYHY